MMSKTDEFDVVVRCSFRIHHSAFIIPH